MIALVTCRAARDLDTDLPLLLAALPDGEAEVASWDDPEVDWAAYDAIVLRSTWDYPRHRDRFLAWVRRVGRRLWNRPELVEWNADKRYLLELQGRGIPIVPTVAVAPGDADGLAAARASTVGDVVVKPAVGAGSNGVRRFAHDSAAAHAHLADLVTSGGAALVQPYLGAIDELGETGLVYLDGEFSHGFAKRAILDRSVGWAGGLFAEEDVRPTVPSRGERELADRIIAQIPTTAYARVDLLPHEDGPRLLELELIEPSLFLDCDPDAAARAAAVFASLGGRRG